MQKGVLGVCFFVFSGFVFRSLCFCSFLFGESLKKGIFLQFWSVFLLDPPKDLSLKSLFSSYLFPLVFLLSSLSKFYLFSLAFVHQPLFGKYYFCVFLLSFLFVAFSFVNACLFFETNVSLHPHFETQVAFIFGCFFLFFCCFSFCFHVLCFCLSFYVGFVFWYVSVVFVVFVVFLFCFLFCFQTMKNIVFPAVLVFLVMLVTRSFILSVSCFFLLPF